MAVMFLDTLLMIGTYDWLYDSSTATLFDFPLVYLPI